MTLHLHIDEVVVEGFALARYDADELRECLTRELSQQLEAGAGGRPEGLAAMERGGRPLTIGLPQGADLAALGRASARALHDAWSGPSPATVQKR